MTTLLASYSLFLSSLRGRCAPQLETKGSTLLCAEVADLLAADAMSTISSRDGESRNGPAPTTRTFKKEIF